MPKRKKVPSDTQTSVLVRSARRCCLCFGLNGDFSEKKGQIAHLDHNPANGAVDNLAFLCLEHHDAFDSSPSQSKGLTKQEVELYREQLYVGLEARLSRNLTYDDVDRAGAAQFLKSVGGGQLFRSTILNAFEIQTAWELGLLVIEPFSPSRLSASGYRLSCGNRALVENELRTLEAPLRLMPGDTALVSTHEIVALPPWLLGKLQALHAGLLRLGLQTESPSSVDPMFRGRLFLAIRNGGTDAAVLSPGMALVTLELSLINVAPTGYHAAFFSGSIA